MGGMRTKLGVVVAVVTAALFGGAVGNDLAEERERQAPRPSAESARTLILAIDNAQLCHREHRGAFTASMADLEQVMADLDPDHFGVGLVATASMEHLEVTLDVSRTGRSYIQRVTGEGIDMFLGRRGRVFLDDGADVTGRVRDDCTERPD